MKKPYILHIISPLDHVSPFDVNMAYDAGFDAVMPYTGVELKEVESLVQDMIFSRSPKDALRTGLFIAGRDAGLALDMLSEARKAMFPPFEISVFADPAGSFTTAAAMIACVEHHLKKTHGVDLRHRHVKVFGGKGVVGSIGGLIAAQAGADATLVGYDGIDGVKKRADFFRTRFGTDVKYVDGSTDELKLEILKDAEVVLCAARAGIQVLTLDQIRKAPELKVVADVNAVPPPGVEGVGLSDDGVQLDQTPGLSIGPLASGNIKFKVQHALFEMMHNTEKPLFLDFQDAVKVARELVD